MAFASQIAALLTEAQTMHSSGKEAVLVEKRAALANALVMSDMLDVLSDVLDTLGDIKDALDTANTTAASALDEAETTNTHLASIVTNTTPDEG